ncbi:MAG: hypothetical protein AAGH82_06220 [Pseudomonadota bacterium]
MGVISLAIAAPMVLVGCQGAKDGAQRFGAANYARFAINKPYTRAANLPDLGETNLLKIGKSTAYGPMIGSYRLSNGDTVYRHFKPQSAGSSTLDLGLVSTEGEAFVVYLTWMRVNAAGIVSEVATGTVPGGNQRCLGFVGGVIRKCEDQAAQDQSLAFYDSVVRTRDGQGVYAAWGAPVTAATPTLSEEQQLERIQPIPGGR